jgi:phospholipid transport system substrate-binding protein
MKTRSRRVRLISGLVTVLLLPAVALAGPATEQLKAHVDRVVQTLEDPALKAPARETERRQRLRRVADDIFDWTDTARRAMGRHWRGLSEAQRQEFVTLFADLLERTYIGRIEQYQGEKIEYVGESGDAEQRTVRTRIVTKQGTAVPIDYRLERQGDRWRVYDVLIEGVSLVSNYRTQFDRIIQTSGYGTLVSKMRARQEANLFEERRR